jgi:hypothetical protein
LKPITLAAALKGLPPETANRQTKTAKTYQVPRYRVVIEVTAHHTFEPLPLNPDKVMTPATQLLTDSKKRRTHTLFDSQSQYLEVTASADTTTVGETQEIKSLRFSQTSFPAIHHGKTTKLNQPCFRGVER